MSPAELAWNFDLPLEAIFAALAYFWTHREEMEAAAVAYDRESERLFREWKGNPPAVWPNATKLTPAAS
jgi:hypothetical protein